jgi:glucose-fructose oxidoreductase
MTQSKKTGENSGGREKIRYAAVGLGHIAQAAALPSFDNAENCELVALVSGDDAKLAEVGDKYGIEHRIHYDDYREFLQKGLVDAVYIALPNHMHCEYTVAAAEAGVHVLCEKPMAVTTEECRRMIDACDQNDVLLMIAYRLHFEAANQQAIEFARNGDLGDLRFFDATFSQDVEEGNIRLNPIEKGGGTLFDMGIYCINAARYLFGGEPFEVMAWSESGDDPRFAECDEMTSAIMRFPGNRLATFTSSFGAAKTDNFRLVGSKGELEVTPAFGYATHLSYTLSTGKDMRSHTFEKRDQFGPEFVYFSDCIKNRTQPEPNGYEGMADVQIIQALYESTQKGSPVRVEPVEDQMRPQPEQEITRPGFEKPEEVHAKGPKRNA